MTEPSHALTDDALTVDFRVWQRRRGHRYSLDDVLTAHEAACAAPDARRVLDLGTGIGSVLLMVAWRLPEARLVGVEAQAGSLALARRNVERNGLGSRAVLAGGDLRDARLLDALPGAPYDLVTGTPPYFPPGTATPSPDPQRAHARHELRGGVEAYLQAAVRRLAPRGRVVMCADARWPERVTDTAGRLGLALLRRRDVVPREGAPPLFTVWVLGRGDGGAAVDATAPFVARDASGRRTRAYRELRASFGFAIGSP
ncbi:MAG: tRNA1(Val) (adenine(37)-N6)-methyltransferase [Myxococcota bacterium]